MAHNAAAPYRIVPVVSPLSNDPSTSGRVVNLPCGGGVCHRQVMMLDDGDYGIHPTYYKRGWRLLFDLYDEEATALQREADIHRGTPEHDAKAALAKASRENKARYESYLVSWEKGTTRSSFPKQWLPREVLDRHRCALPDAFADAFRSPPVTGAVSEGPKPRKGGEVRS